MCAGGQRKRRAVPRRRRQAAGTGEEEEEDVEAEFNPENPYQVSHANKLARSSSSAVFTSRRGVWDCPFTSAGYLRRLSPGRVSHSCASGSRCWGHGRGARDCHCRSECMRGCVFRACVLYARLSQSLSKAFPFSTEAV